MKKEKERDVSNTRHSGNRQIITNKCVSYSKLRKYQMIQGSHLQTTASSFGKIRILAHSHQRMWAGRMH